MYMENLCEKCAYGYNNNCDINATPYDAKEIMIDDNIIISVVLDCPCFEDRKEYFKKYN